MHPVSTDVNNVAPVADTDGLEIIAARSIGSFLATTIRASDPQGLVVWLRNNGFQVTEPEARLLGGYVSRGWVFTAMKLDPASPEAWLMAVAKRQAIDAQRRTATSDAATDGPGSPLTVGVRQAFSSRSSASSTDWLVYRPAPCSVRRSWAARAPRWKSAK